MGISQIADESDQRTHVSSLGHWLGDRAPMLLSISDYVLQGIIAVLFLVHPWFLRPGQSRRAFWFPFLTIFAWGIWRMAYFDPATNNDIPGIGYLVVAFAYSSVANLFFAVRCAILRRRAKRNAPGNA